MKEAKELFEVGDPVSVRFTNNTQEGYVDGVSPAHVPEVYIKTTCETQAKVNLIDFQLLIKES